ncbi:MAG TPA: hypothetical protein VHU14_06675 [Solirubrobacterales bacterium]|jgi:hypothetical protein|nr:hypothetical protein [Solirubrobacterales bacterium]
MLTNPHGAAQLMGAAEAEAVQRVGEAMSQRSLLSGTGEEVSDGLFSPR